MNIKAIVKNPDKFRLNQKNRFIDTTLIDELLKYNKLYTEIKSKYDTYSKLRTKAKSFIKKAQPTATIDLLIDKLDDYDYTLLNLYTKEQLIELSKFVSEKIEYIKIDMLKYKNHKDSIYNEIGNILHESVIIDKDEKKNKTLYKFDGYKPKSTKYIHNDLCEKLGFIEYTKGIQIAGNRGYFMKHNGVKFNRALMNYAMDFLEKHEYELLYTPHFMQHDSIKDVSQLSEFKETLYKVGDKEQYLIATSEQPITSYFKDTRFEEGELPKKVAGISTCYRKETGACSRDTKGIFRVHQFEKLEQFCITDKDNSWEMMNKMIDISRKFYESLGIGYKVINIVSGSLNNSAAMKYDLEGYFPGSDNHKELVSCSNCLNYFSQRLNCKDHNKEYVHMLNSTLCANTRTICCLVETYQTETGMDIPKVLQPYLGLDHINFI